MATVVDFSGSPLLAGWRFHANPPLQRPLETHQPADECIVAGMRVPGIVGADGEVERDFGRVRQRWAGRNVQPRRLQPRRSHGDEKRFDGRLSAAQRPDPPGARGTQHKRLAPQTVGFSLSLTSDAGIEAHRQPGRGATGAKRA